MLINEQRNNCVMSMLLLIAIRNKHAIITNSHFADILAQLNNRVKGSSIPLDAGYLIVDYDSATVISSQSAFSAHHLTNPLLKRFSWIVI